MLTERSGAADYRGGSAPSTGDQERARTGLYVLVVLTAGAYLPSPLYPVYQDVFAISDLTMTLLYATFAVVSAPALLLFGTASDAVGPRSMLRAAIAAAAVGTACFALASGPTWLLAGRAAQGLALGAATGAAGALIGDGTRPGSRVSGAVLAGIAFVAGTAAGPVAGGVLAQYAPAPQFVPYVLHLAWLWVCWRRLSSLAAAGPRGRRWRPTRPEIPHGMRLLFGSAAATGFLAWAVAGLFLAVIPTLLDRSGQTNPAVTGCILGAVLVCSVLTQPFVARLGARSAQLAGLGALLVSLGVLAVTAGGSTSATLGAAVVAGAGHGLAYGGAAAAIDAIAPPGRRGGVTGALYLAFYLGSACPAVAVGLVTLAHPLATATFWVTAVAAGLVPLAAAAVALRGAEQPGKPWRVRGRRGRGGGTGSRRVAARPAARAGRGAR